MLTKAGHVHIDGKHQSVKRGGTSVCLKHPNIINLRYICPSNLQTLPSPNPLGFQLHLIGRGSEGREQCHHSCLKRLLLCLRDGKITARVQI